MRHRPGLYHQAGLGPGRCTGMAELTRQCLVLLQVAATLSGIVLGSAALFAYHCANRQIWLAGLHPPLMYGLLILLLLPLPLRILSSVG